MLAEESATDRTRRRGDRRRRVARSPARASSATPSWRRRCAPGGRSWSPTCRPIPCSRRRAGGGCTSEASPPCAPSPPSPWPPIASSARSCSARASPAPGSAPTEEMFALQVARAAARVVDADLRAPSANGGAAHATDPLTGLPDTERAGREDRGGGGAREALFALVQPGAARRRRPGRASTPGSAARPATGCSRSWGACSSRRCARRTSSPATAATSSRWCWRRPAPTARATWCTGSGASWRRIRSRDCRRAKMPRVSAGIVAFPHPAVEDTGDMLVLLEAALRRGKGAGGGADRHRGVAAAWGRSSAVTEAAVSQPRRRRPRRGCPSGAAVRSGTLTIPSAPPLTDAPSGTPPPRLAPPLMPRMAPRRRSSPGRTPSSSATPSAASPPDPARSDSPPGSRSAGAVRSPSSPRPPSRPPAPWSPDRSA